MLRFSKASLVSCLSLASLPWVMSNAIAQNAAPAQTSAPSDDLLQEVTVTAQFRSENVQQTSIAITAINAQMLEQRSQSNIADVANQAPNVTLKPQGMAFGPSLAASIRGIGQYDFNPAVEPGVGMYVDDVYYSTLTGSILDLLDLERVEILRGPQGTLAGKNSIGGAVKLYSRRPDGTDESSVEALYGSRNHLELRASAGFTVVPEHLFMRLSGVVNRQDGYVQVKDYACLHPESGLPRSFQTRTGSCDVATEGGKDYSALRAAIRWVLNDKFEVNLIGDITHDTSENPATTLLIANNPNPNVALNGIPFDSRFISADPYVNFSTYSMPAATYSIPFPPFTVNTPGYEGRRGTKFLGWGGSATVDWELADKLSLKSISAVRGYNSDWFVDNDASPLPVNLGHENLTHHQFSQELRLNGSIGEPFDYTVGGYYFKQITTYATHQDLLYVPVVGPLFDFLGNDPVEAHTKAAFAQGVFHATDKLNVTLGVRYTKEDKDYTYYRLNPDGTINTIIGGAPPNTLNGRTGHYEGSRTDYRADVDYRWTENFMTYAQVSTGFKGGGINPRPFFPFQVQSFAPETLTTYEIGVKSELLDHRLRLNAAVFDSKYKDIQLTLLSCDFLNPPGTPAGQPCALPANAGDATLKGVELEIEAHPFAGLQFDASASYLDFDYTRINAAAGGPRGVQDGMISPYTPKTKASIGGQYTIPVGSWGSITPRLDASYQDEMFTNAVNGPNNRVAGYTLMNARLTWKSMSETWQTSLEVLNLGDKVYFHNVFDLTGTGAGQATGQLGAPREFAISVKHKM